MKTCLLLLLVASCAQVTSLNLRRHEFGRQPSKVVWFQVAGLDAEHLALLRFGGNSIESRTEMEGALCAGRAWSFNLYDLRPAAAASFLAQTTGKKDVRGSCEDWSLRPLWSYLAPYNYKTGVLEIGAPEASSWSSTACGKPAANFRGQSTLWVMGPKAPAGSVPYLPSEQQDFEAGKVYWDRSCGPIGCGTNLGSVLSALYPPFAKNTKRHVLVVRDHSYARALEARDYRAATEILREIDKSVGLFMRAAETGDDMLVLVSGAAAVDLDFPAAGKEWQQFMLKGTHMAARHTELSSPVFAHGARAENFCGVYEESQIFDRILSGPKQQGLELKIINPFN
jgi:hypothetical protein